MTKEVSVVPRVRSALSPRMRLSVAFSGPTMTKQSFRDECDVNLILKRFESTGVVDHLASSNPRYGDFTSAEDYQTSLNIVMSAEDSFMSLDPKIRLRFDNDPVLFLDFVGNPANNTELIALGLAKPSIPVEKPGFAASSAAPEQLPT